MGFPTTSGTKQRVQLTQQSIDSASAATRCSERTSLVLPLRSNASHTPERISSTIVSPSSSNVSSQPGVLEGWRAVWIIITRYGALQRQRQGLSRTSTDRAIRTLSHDVLPVEDVEMEDEVQAMVAGVKKHGGRELLKYVKGLLG
ncbi:hypothetical protein QCA50_005821 [Cerrena zonata]|uniref:Uncharacterized protein n=1 Tax=Cerrena zonata TaxID=2478898 RepID=A0AAW0GG88_9APHY